MGKWSELSAGQKARIIRFAIDNGVSDIKSIRDTYDIYSSGNGGENEYKEGGSIHIKHPGRLTALKKRTGKTEAELWATGNAHTRKMITFARNARKWHKHDQATPESLADVNSGWLRTDWRDSSTPEEIRARLLQQSLPSTATAQIRATTKEDIERRKKETERLEFAQKIRPTLEQAVNTMAIGNNFNTSAMSNEALLDLGSKLSNQWNYITMATDPVGALLGLGFGEVGSDVGKNINKVLGSPVSEEAAETTGGVLGGLFGYGLKPNFAGIQNRRPIIKYVGEQGINAKLPEIHNHNSHPVFNVYSEPIPISPVKNNYRQITLPSSNQILALPRSATADNRTFLKKVNRYLSKYGYDPIDLSVADKGFEATNRAVLSQLEHLNTFGRGVYTIRDNVLDELKSLHLSMQEAERWLGNRNIYKGDFYSALKINKKLKELGLEPSEENRLKYALTHIPGNTGHGRAGLFENEAGLYTSNSYGDAESVAGRYSSTTHSNPDYYVGAQGILQRKYNLSPANERDNWLFEADFPLLSAQSRSLYPIFRHILQSPKIKGKIKEEAKRKLQNAIFQKIEKRESFNRRQDNILTKRKLDNVKKYLKDAGIPYNFNFESKEQLNAVARFLEMYEDPALYLDEKTLTFHSQSVPEYQNFDFFGAPTSTSVLDGGKPKLTASMVYRILNANPFGKNTPLFQKAPTIQELFKFFGKEVKSGKANKEISDIINTYLPDYSHYLQEPKILTTEYLTRAKKGTTRTQHFIFTGSPDDEPVMLKYFIPTNYENAHHGHYSDYNPGSRKTYSTGGPLYPFSFQKNPYWKTPVVRYDEGGFIDTLKSLYRKASNSAQQAVNNIVAKEHSYVGLPTTDNRPYNPDYMSYIEKGLTGRGINGNRLPALLGSIAEESGGNPFAISTSGAYQGLVQWGPDRYVIPDTSIDPYKAIDLQLDTLVSTLRNSKDKTSWTHGGTGSGYNSKMEPFNEFWSDTTSVEGVTKALNLGYIRPGGKHASVANRTRVAQHINDTVLKR